MPPHWDESGPPLDARPLRSRAHLSMTVRRERRAKRMGYWRLRDSPHINLAVAFVLLAGTLALVLAPRGDAARNVPAMDAARIERALGVAGRFDGTSYRLALPRYDLAVRVQDVPVQPELALETRVLFWGDNRRATADGELVVTESEMAGTVRKLSETGFEVTDLHIHPPAAIPPIVHLHVRKAGDPGDLAHDVREVLTATATPLEPQHDAAVAPHPVFDRVRRALDREVQVVGQVLHVTVPARRHAGGEPTGSEVRVQPGDRETVLAAGDFVVPDRQVSALSQTLTDGGATVTGLSPAPSPGDDRRYRLHAWLHDRADRVLPALRNALGLVERD